MTDAESSRDEQASVQDEAAIAPIRWIDRVTLHSGRGARSGWTAWIAPLVLFLAAVGLRALPIRDRLYLGRLQFFGDDAYYHMRRVVYILENFPASLDYDRYINFPSGARAIWSPLFDWSTALVLMPVQWALGATQVEFAAIWIPPLFGGATVVALYLVALANFGRVPAIAAGAILTLMSGHFWYSQVGFLDHHCAVALVTTWLLGAAMGLLRVLSGPDGTRREFVRPAAATGAALGTTLLLWPGALLHVAVVETGLAFFLMSRGTRAAAIGVAKALAVAHTVALCLVAPFCLGQAWPQWSAFSPVVLSAFQPWLFGCAALALAACALTWKHRAGTGESSWRRGAGVSLIGLGLLGLSLLLWPALIEGGSEAWEWLAKRDDFQALVGESFPLFSVGDRFSTQIATLRLSYFVLVVPIALGFFASTLRRLRVPAPFALYLWWTLCLCAATLLQRRFFNSASVAIALLMALTLVQLYHFLPHRMRCSPPRRAAAAGALLLVGAALLVPCYRPYWRHLQVPMQPRDAAAAYSHPSVLRNARLGDAARWIRSHTTPTSGWLDSGQQPEYAVMAGWSLGHVIEYTARRPTVTTNFGDDVGAENFLLARDYFRSREADAVSILDEVRARYVLTEASVGTSRPARPKPDMFHSLYLRGGSRSEGPGDERAPALSRHRLVFETAPYWTEGRAERFQVYEVVPGALIVGQARPGARVGARLPLLTNLGRSFTYRTSTTADRSGRYELRLPYSTDRRPMDAGRGEAARTQVQAHARYTLMCDEVAQSLRVAEAAVWEGRTVTGPTLCR